MKRIHPYKILAVAIGAGVAGLGCNTPPKPDPSANVAAATSATSTMPQATGTTTAAQVGAQAQEPPHAPPLDSKADPKLLALREELDRTSGDQIVARQDHFKPLCDKDGYPLVGNIQRKSLPGEGSSPSAFCTTLRTKKPS